MGSRAGGAPASVRLRRRAQRLELCLEQGLVDLPLVDRNALLDADADDLAPLDAQLLRQLVRRQVVRHVAPPWSTKKPAGALRGRARETIRLPLRESMGPPPLGVHRARRIITAGDGRNGAQAR